MGAATKCAEEGIGSEQCHCTGEVYYGPKYLNGVNGTETTLEDIKTLTHKMIHQPSPNGNLLCSQAAFYPNGYNPNPGVQHHCFCQSELLYKTTTHMTGGPLACEAGTFNGDNTFLENTEKYCMCKGIRGMASR